jgi:N-acetylglucosaminyl-diphospho-decaprenol L-rhamnosyltransferase
MTVRSVLVAVVTYNSAALLQDLVDSLNDGLAGLDWELAIADNASSDDSVAEARRVAPYAQVVSVGRNAGYAAGVNAAVAAARREHDAVLVLNPDVRLDAECVTRLARALDEPGVGIAVPRLRNGSGELIASMRREPTVVRSLADAVIGADRAGRWRSLGEVVTDPSAYERRVVTDWAEGSTQLVSAACWRACGPWDESYFLYSEETDYDLRARDAGYATLFVPEAGAVHLEGGSGTTPNLWALLVVNRVRLYRRRHGRIGTALFWFTTLLREASRASRGGVTNRAAVRALVTPSILFHAPGPSFLALVGRSVRSAPALD